ncbi:glycoside hydrolase family 44 protein [Fibrobacter sp. UWB3]|uniref:glycoside hydrolase family 44 protein n=1 Tax=Fibrobacter sp. UWB3 TaxID=1964357 RepID=UPI000B523387|nr:glycoside hydrolase family 44 protein [Fibrobacter sp. UWB3]OWV22870.1 glycoside hydrolase [Fibrobacter sp. UWB3]
MGYSNFFTVAAFGTLFAVSPTLAIDITVDANAGIKKISPYLYGRNIDKISDGDAEVTEEESAFINQMLEAGIHMLRANNGNNATRYNWRHKMTVHPDWYNNVYSHDWAITAQKVLDKMPGVDAMYAFQLTGYAASSTDYNFPDWNWKQEHGTYATQTFDLAGGGEVSEDGKTLIKAGDPSLYNMEWPADSTVAIIPHWKDELKFDMSRFKYWSMDNEMEIWRGTHNDLDLPVTGDFLVERYIDVAKKARAAWGDIKLTGPVAANEWQWCSVSSYNKEDRPKGEDRNYCWLEYFIMKVAEEQKKSGVRLLDVFDIHWYPTEKDYESRVNWHRVMFDTTYNYPGANGIKMVGGNWDNKITKEYIFARINQWLEKYFGKNHGITFGITETSIIDNDPMVTALIYASFLGTMQDNGVEIFTPWTWGDGMYETVHLFSRYGHPNRVQSTSSNDSLVSAYSSISNKGDSLTVIFVNRAEKDAQDIDLNLANFASDGKVKTLTLQNLKGETFVSHTSNALKENAVEAKTQGGTTTATGNSINRFKMTLPAKSITAVLLTTTTPKQIDAIAHTRSALTGNLLHHENSNWFIDNGSGKVRRINVFNSLGQSVLRMHAIARGNIRIASEVLSKGNFIVRIETASGTQMQKITVK